MLHIEKRIGDLFSVQQVDMEYLDLRCKNYTSANFHRKIDLFEEVTKSQASGWVVEAEDYKMPPVPMHFYRLVTLDSFFGNCCFLIIFRSVCLQLIGFSEWELLDKYM